MSKRQNESEAPDKKRAKVDMLDNDPEVNIPEGLEPDSSDHESDKQPKLTPSERKEVRKLKKMIQKAYEDAPHATNNPNIHLQIHVWHEMTFEPDLKSLANILHTEEYLSEDGLIKLASSPSPVSLPPLDRPNARALWMSLRYRYKLDDVKCNGRFAPDIPEEWLRIELKSKIFGKPGGDDFAKKLVADIAFNQKLFLDRKEHWFIPMCETLGWDISTTFYKRFRIVLFAACVDPKLINTSTEDIGDSWATEYKKVKTAFFNVVKTGVKKKKILYPSTFNLLKEIFPSISF